MGTVRLTVGHYQSGQLVSAQELKAGTRSFDNVMEYLEGLKDRIMTGETSGAMNAGETRIETAETNGSDGWVFVEELA